MSDFTSNKPYLIRSLYEWILDNEGTPHLVVNADFPGVQVPREYVNQGEIVLNISPGATQGLRMENCDVTFNARFSGVARVIFLPMDSILAIIARENGEGMAFPPEEFSAKHSADKSDEAMDDENSGNMEAKEELATDNKKPTIASVSADKRSSDKKPNTKSGKKPGSHLKVIK